METKIIIKSLESLTSILSNGLNDAIKKILELIDSELKSNAELIKSDEYVYYDICVTSALPTNQKLVFSRNFQYQLYLFGTMVRHYKALVPDFECEIYAYPYEKRADLIVNHSAKSVLNKDLIENRRCHTFQNHTPNEPFNYSADQDLSWNDFRTHFYFEFPLKNIL